MAAQTVISASFLVVALAIFLMVLGVVLRRLWAYGSAGSLSCWLP